MEAGEKVQAPSKERREPPLENEKGAPGKRGEDSESSAPLAGSKVSVVEPSREDTSRADALAKNMAPHLKQRQGQRKERAAGESMFL